jgi:membrane protein
MPRGRSSPTEDNPTAPGSASFRQRESGESRRRPAAGKLGAAWDLLKTTGQNWMSDRAPKMAAALAYYTAFAVAPILLIAIAVAGLVFGQEAARGEVVTQISGLVGKSGAETIQQILTRAWQPKTGILATVFAVLALLYSSSGVFGELQDSLDTIWKVRKKEGRGILGTLKDRFFSFSMVVGVGFLLVVSLVLSTALDALGDYLAGSNEGSVLIRAVNFLISFAVVAAVFAAMFRVLPDARTRWRDVWIGAAMTSALFTLGKFLIGLYLGKTTVGQTYGAAGSFVIFMLWVNYSAQIVFFGAELTKTFADRFGTPPEPKENAVRIDRSPLEAPPRPEPQHARSS